MTITIINMIKSNNKIIIVSGEGTVGTAVTYNGAHGLRAIKARLTKERCGGARWAKALVLSHQQDGIDVFVNIESGEYCVA